MSDLLPEWMVEGAARVARDREIRERERQDWDNLDEWEQRRRTNAYRMRLNPTEAEWRARRIIEDLNPGAKVIPQAVVGPFIVDFLLPDRGIVIEVDGGYHRSELQAEKDAKRTEYLERAGYEVRRLTNAEVNAHWRRFYGE